jgi:hypothetical protein
MDPASVFLLYIVGVLGLWLLALSIHPAIALVSRASVGLPIGRRFAAVVVSLCLIGSIGMAKASVGPASERMVAMADAGPAISTTGLTIIHRPLMASVGSTYTVVAGDSLWKIARTILATDGQDVGGSSVSDLWRAIYDANRDLIGSNPNLIHPGQVLNLPGR